MNFKENELVFLFGAGASVDAGIPASNKMIENVENLIQSEWATYKELYYLVKSAVIYADGVQGIFDNHDSNNIERLFNVLLELEKKEQHPLYPFIGQWNIKFSEVIKDKYSIIKDFQNVIFEKLREWVSFEKGSADYYKQIGAFRKEYEYPLNIFTLNYDLCVENTLSSTSKIERGFNESKVWDYKKYEQRSEFSDYDIYLYKLHGSIDWDRDEKTGQIQYNNINLIKKPDLIFGNIYKLQYVDPYLFQFYELRKYTLDAKLVIAVGYSFADQHINGILAQAINQDKKMKLLWVSPDARKSLVKEKLGLSENAKRQIETMEMTAKIFFDKKLKLNTLSDLFPKEEDNELWS